MASLTEVSVMTRKIIMWIALAVVAYLVLRILFGLAVSYWKATHPVAVPGPNVLFGPIPAPKFPDTLPRTSGLNLTLLTIEGSPQEASNAGKVYFMPKKLPSLLAPQKARELAVKLKFSGEPEIVSSSLYIFRDPTRTLQLDIVNNNFVYKINFAQDSSLFAEDPSFNQAIALDNAKGFFGSTGVADSSMMARNIVSFLHYASDTGTFSPVLKAADANSARVNFFRPDMDEMKLLPPEYTNSYTYAIVSPSKDEEKRVAEAHYVFWPIDMNNYGTYPLISSATAWQNIQDGRGVVASFGTNTKDKEIIVRKNYLAYYDSGLAETYLQPIFVFEGDNGFAAYTQAIDPAYLDEVQ